MSDTAVVMKPTKGESLLIWRRRRGLNQIEAAQRFKVHPDTYRDWEADKRPNAQPWRNVGQLRANERCVLARRRAGLRQRELAERIGLSRLWVIQMENGDAPADRLCEFWRV